MSFYSQKCWYFGNEGSNKQAENLKSRELKEGWWRMMKDDDFKLLRGFADWRTDGRTFVIVESLSRLKNNSSCQARLLLIFSNLKVSIQKQEEQTGKTLPARASLHRAPFRLPCDLKLWQSVKLKVQAIIKTSVIYIHHEKTLIKTETRTSSHFLTN